MQDIDLQQDTEQVSALNKRKRIKIEPESEEESYWTALEVEPGKTCSRSNRAFREHSQHSGSEDQGKNHSKRTEEVFDSSDSEGEDLEVEWSSKNIEEEQSITSTGTQKRSQNLDRIEAEEFFLSDSSETSEIESSEGSERKTEVALGGAIITQCQVYDSIEDKSDLDLIKFQFEVLIPVPDCQKKKQPTTQVHC